MTSRQSVNSSQTSPATPPTQRFTPITCERFRLFPVRSPLLGESRLISFPPGTEMVQFPGCTPLHLWIQCRVTHRQTRRVTPFGYPGISGCVLLPPASRSLPRPSSYSSSKASTMNPFSLDHIFSLPSRYPVTVFVPLRVALRLTTLRNLSRQVLPVPMDRPARPFFFFLPSSCQRPGKRIQPPPAAALSRRTSTLSTVARDSGGMGT